MKLTEFQMRRIYDMAVDAYEAKQDNVLTYANRVSYAIFQALDILADKQLKTSEGWDIVFSNGNNPPTEKSIAEFLEKF